MPLTTDEALLVEALQVLLNRKTLGLTGEPSDTDNGVTYLRENVIEQFALDTLNLVHHDGICAAFRKITDARYVTDPTFAEALASEFRSLGVPENEQHKALEVLRSLVKKLRGERKHWNQKDAGWNPQLDEIIDASQPELYK
jgi:hypothetical protein